MSWITALVKAILEWLTAEVKKDTKAGDADPVPKSIKDRWRKRIQDQLDKQNKKEDEETTKKPNDS